jgi:DNA polymerase III delta subunit
MARSGATQAAAFHLIAGDEPFLKEEALEAIARGLPGEVDVVPVLPPAGEKGPPTLAAVLEEVRTAPLAGGRKLVVVRGADALLKEHDEKLRALAGRMPAFSVLALVLDAAKVPEAVARAFAGCATVFVGKKPYDRPGPWERNRPVHDSDLTRWLVARARTRGLALGLEEAFLLVGRVGDSLRELDGELGKLALAFPKGHRVSAADLASLVGERRSSTAFVLTDAVADRERDAALQALRAVLDGGLELRGGERVTDAGAAFMPVFRALQIRWLGLIAGRAALDAGADPDGVARAAGVAPFFKERAQRQVRAWSPAELRAGLVALHTADRSLKEGLTEPGLTLELLVLDLLGGKSRWA